MYLKAETNLPLTPNAIPKLIKIWWLIGISFMST